MVNMYKNIYGYNKYTINDIILLNFCFIDVDTYKKTGRNNDSLQTAEL